MPERFQLLIEDYLAAEGTTADCAHAFEAFFDCEGYYYWDYRLDHPMITLCFRNRDESFNINHALARILPV